MTDQSSLKSLEEFIVILDQFCSENNKDGLISFAEESI